MIYSFKYYCIICISTICLIIFQNIIRCYSQDILYSVPVSIDGIPKSFQLMKGESLETAAFNFAQDNNLFQSNDQLHINSVVSELKGLIENKIQEQNQPQVLFTIPVNVDNINVDLKVYDGKTINESILAFFEEYGIFDNNIRNQISPRLIQAIHQKANELRQDDANMQNQQQVMFTLTFTIDGQRIELNHIDGANPMTEAIQACTALGIKDQATINEIAPQIANSIQQRINEIKSQQQPINNGMMVSVDVTIDDKIFPMVHQIGSSPADSVMSFLRMHGIDNEDAINQYGPTLINMINEKIRAAQQLPPRELISIPLVINGNDVTLKYFEGNDPEKVVIDFLQGNGISNREDIISYGGQLLKIIQDRLNEDLNNPDSAINNTNIIQNIPIATLKVTLNNKLYNVEVFENQQPETVAKEFCRIKWPEIQSQLGEIASETNMKDCEDIVIKGLHDSIRQSNALMIEHANDTVTPERTGNGSFKLDNLQENIEHSNETSSIIREEKLFLQQNITKNFSDINETLSGKTLKNDSNISVNDENTDIIDDNVISYSSNATDTLDKSDIKSEKEKTRLFTLNIDLGNGKFADLVYNEGDDPEFAAKKFCMDNSINLENISIIIDMIKDQTSN